MSVYTYDKMKFANEKEDKRLRRRLKQIAKGHTDTLQVLHKDKCDVVAELRAYRVREIRNTVRESLRLEQDIQKQRLRQIDRQLAQSQTYRPQLLAVHGSRRLGGGVGELGSGGRGFSQVRLDPEDVPPRRERERVRTYSDDDSDSGELGARQPKPVQYTASPKHNFTVLYYPTRPKRAFARAPMTSAPGFARETSNLKVIDQALGRTSLEQIPKRHLPSYVEDLAKLENEHFDQFTDGSMALEMRRFKQIQRERMPALAGHLPVRTRYTFNFDAKGHLQRIRSNLLLTEADSEDGAGEVLRRQRTLGVLDPSKARHYVAKSTHGEEAARKQIASENRKLDKLKQASQAARYKETLSRVDSFLGMPAKGQTLVHQERLTREETLMLKHLSLDPGFVNMTTPGQDSSVASRMSRMEGPGHQPLPSLLLQRAETKV